MHMQRPESPPRLHHRRRPRAGSGTCTAAGRRGGGHHRTELAGPVDMVSNAPATPEDPAETVKEVEALDRRVVHFTADDRDYDGLKASLNAGVAELGGLDVLVANAGIINSVLPRHGPSWCSP
jgi:NAD(P)-dependent dehydrogenase (short-subunit alcohol dehydrogenase family)